MLLQNLHVLMPQFKTHVSNIFVFFLLSLTESYITLFPDTIPFQILTFLTHDVINITNTN